MRNRRNQFVASLIPLLLFGIVWRLNWQRLHPPPTSLDTKVRNLLLAADKIEVTVDFVEIPVGWVRTPITTLKPQELAPVLQNLNLTSKSAMMWRTGYEPDIYFIFYQRGQNIAEISVSYSEFDYNYFFVNTPQFSTWVSKGLHPTTIRRFREWIARHPELIRALVEKGARPQDLDVNKLPENNS